MLPSPWTERLEDWDYPSKDVDAFAAKFSHETITDGNITLPYRLFVPESFVTQSGITQDAASEAGAPDQPARENGKKTPPEFEDSPPTPAAYRIPLVLFLHGADVTGNDNEVHLRGHDIGTMFAREEWQKDHPCVIVAPQYRNGIHWSRPRVMGVVKRLLGELCEAYPMIDPTRIYAYGYSAGGIGLLRMMKTYTELFAGALILCGATNNEELQNLKKTPFWLFHALDDGIVSAYGYSGAHLGSKALYEALREEMGDRLRYTEYVENEIQTKYGINPHCAWVPVASDEEAKAWLFQQRRGNDISNISNGCA